MSHTEKPVPSMTLADVGQLIVEVVYGVLAGIFTTVARTLVHRTSLVLLAFTLVHAAGNLLIFLGHDVYNAYADHLRSNLAVQAIEYYLVLATLGHSCSGVYLSVVDGKLLSWHTARLFLTGLVLAAFLCVHMLHFRFSAAAHEDLHKEVLRVLASQPVALGYTVSCLLLGAHAYWGWDKAASKLGRDEATGKPALTPGARAFGHYLVLFLTAAFTVVAIGAHFQGAAVERAQGEGRG